MGRRDLLDKPRFKTNADRAENMDDIILLINWEKDKKKWEVVRDLLGVQVPAAPVLSIAEVANDPHLKARKMIREIEHPRRGKNRVPGSPIRLSDSMLENVTPAPGLGQDTERILQEMTGLNQEQ